MSLNWPALPGLIFQRKREARAEEEAANERRREQQRLWYLRPALANPHGSGFVARVANLQAARDLDAELNAQQYEDATGDTHLISQQGDSQRKLSCPDLTPVGTC